MKRGEVYWADLVPRSGSEQTGRRPAILVSHDAFNQTATWKSVVVVPMSTSQSQARRSLTSVEIPARTCGLPNTGFALCHQVTTLDRSKLTQRIGVLSPDALESVESALKNALDLE